MKRLVSGILPLLVLAGCGASPSQEVRRDFPAPATLPQRPELPDPLVSFDGRKVETRDQWEKERKPELKSLFQHYMYGFMIPPV
jgi:(4-O-methyl)-D-glucuronate---lignin esterase